MAKDEKSTRRKRGKKGGTITDEKESKPKGKTVEGSQRSIRRRTKKTGKNKEQEEPKDKTVCEDVNKSGKGKGGGKGTKRKVASAKEQSVMVNEVKPPPPPPPPANVGADTAVLTYGLTIPDELRSKLTDPERDERSIKGKDPDNPSPEQIKRLQSFVAQYITLGAKGLIEEFDKVKTYNVDLPAHTASHQANPTKNRYRDIFCIEPSRVILKDKDGDYINANHVRGPPFLNDFICTQGPLEGTINDFWKMVVQENVGYIVMLCDLIELGKKKCEKYIPEKEGESVVYGEYKVTLMKMLIDGHFINSILTIDVPGSKARIVYHHQWKNWPDRGVPLTALAGLRVLRHARLTNCSTIIHCSAGVGRTGTLVAIEYMLQTIINNDGPYDMIEMVKNLRNQRAHAIQTAPQYAYVAQAILRKMVTLDPSPEANAKYQQFAGEMKAFSAPPPPPPPPPPSEPAAAP